MTLTDTPLSREKITGLKLPVSHFQHHMKRVTSNLVYIFGNDVKKALIDCETIEEYENKLKEFYEILSFDKELTVFFKKYLKK